ncbi:MAG: PadR family transcriptional regulator [Bdellovibrionales bacterium]
MNSQFKKGVIELCVLSLVKNRDYYGYELVEEISKKVDIAEGTIYPILRRLTQDKLFETYLRESNEGPPRKYYRITKLGRQVQSEQIVQWKEFNKNINALLRTGESHDQGGVSQRIGRQDQRPAGS